MRKPLSINWILFLNFNAVCRIIIIIIIIVIGKVKSIYKRVQTGQRLEETVYPENSFIKAGNIFLF